MQALHTVRRAKVDHPVTPPTAREAVLVELHEFEADLPRDLSDDGSPRFRAWARWLARAGSIDPAPASRDAWVRARAKDPPRGPGTHTPIAELDIGIVLTVTGWGPLEIAATRAAWVKVRQTPRSQLVVVQNDPACWEECEVWCANYPDLEVVSVENNGFAHANNRGAAVLRRHEYVLFTQADVKWTIEDLALATFTSNAWEGATVGPSGGRVCRDGMGNVSEYGRNVTGVGSGAMLEERRVDWIGGYWFLCPRAAFDVVGGWSECFFLYSEDPDLSMRLEIAQSQQVVVPWLRVDHQRSTSISASFTNETRAAIQNHSRRRFNQRWGGI